MGETSPPAASVGDSLALIHDLEAAGAISTIGLHLNDPDLPYAQFEALCLLLGKLHEAVRFAIGDALILGEKLYKEQAYQAFELLNVSERGRQEYIRVSERVARSTRRKDVSWSHHRAVAALPPPEQRKWLREASERQLSHHALRDELRNDAAPAAVGVCRCCGRSLAS